VHTEKLVYASTDDGLLLEGVLMRPSSQPRSPSFVWIHGNAARFYDYAYVAICRALADAGYACLSGNTRGHDIAAFVWRGADDAPRAWRGPQDFPIGGGAGWEDLEDAPRDVAAWVRTLEGVVVVVGHSSGAQRVVAYFSQQPDNRVCGLALASPDFQGFTPPGELALAEQMVAEGRGMEVVPAQPFAPFYRQSAAAIISRARAVKNLDFRSVACPVLAFVGEREPGADALAETVRQKFTTVEVVTIPDADHVYSSCTRQVANVLIDWATRVFSTA
jgi:pimeloyl-ACP methyl ester carboxylesterase